MNWSVTAQGKSVGKALNEAEPHIERAEGESEDAKPKAAVVDAAIKAAADIASAYGRQGKSVEIRAHETHEGEGFKPAHVTVTISLLDPAGLAL